MSSDPPVLVPVALFVGGLGVWVLAAAARSLLFGILSRHWPTVLGTITESSVVESSQGARVSITYQYSVAGVSHIGTTLGFASPGSRWHASSNRSGVRALAQKYPVGLSTPVFYWPLLSAVSVLQPGFHWMSLILFVVGSCWVVLGATLLLLAVG